MHKPGAIITPRLQISSGRSGQRIDISCIKLHRDHGRRTDKQALTGLPPAEQLAALSRPKKEMKEGNTIQKQMLTYLETRIATLRTADREELYGKSNQDNGYPILILPGSKSNQQASKTA